MFGFSNNSACNPCDMDTSDTRAKSPETSANSLPAVSPMLIPWDHSIDF